MSDAGMKGTFVQQEAEQQKELGQLEMTTGAQLAALRNAMGWSIDQVAEQLKLAPRQIVAIEQNDFAALPGMAIARGFVRAYAKLLKTDAVPLLAAIPGEAPNSVVLPVSRPDLSAPFSESRIPFRYRRSGSSKSKSLYGAAILVSLLIVVLVVFALGWRPALLNSISARLDKQAPSVAASVVAEKLVPVESAPSMSSTPAVSSVVAQAPVLAAASAEPTATVSSPSTPASTAPMPEVAAAKSSGDLVIAVHEDSWVQIKRSDGSTLVSRILRTGETESFEITGPVMLTVGNVAGVKVTLRGEPLNIKPKNNGNTVRLKLE